MSYWKQRMSPSSGDCVPRGCWKEVAPPHKAFFVFLLVFLVMYSFCAVLLFLFFEPDSAYISRAALPLTIFLVSDPQGPGRFQHAGN